MFIIEFIINVICNVCVAQIKPTHSSILKRTGNYIVQLFDRTSSHALGGVGNTSSAFQKITPADVHAKNVKVEGANAKTQKLSKQQRQQLLDPYYRQQYDAVSSDESWHYEPEELPAAAEYTEATPTKPVTPTRRSAPCSESQELRARVERMLREDTPAEIRVTRVIGSTDDASDVRDARLQPTNADCFYKRNDEVGDQPIYPFGNGTSDD